jgi:hypothetical protein
MITRSIALLVIFLGAAVSRAGTFEVPLDRTNGWLFLKYSKIPSNAVHTTPAGLKIGVTNSAAPAVFPLTNILRITELRAKGRLSGSLKIPAGRQGEKAFDDYALRVGVVEPGTRTLNWREKLLAADWVKRLFALAPPGTGISKVHFFNVGADAAQLGITRPHPKSNLMEETVLVVPDAQGNFAFTNHFTHPLPVLAVWISADGDNSKSSFAVLLEKIELSVEDSLAK